MSRSQYYFDILYPFQEQVLCSVNHADWEAVLWIDPPDAGTFLAQLIELGEKLLLLK